MARPLDQFIADRMGTPFAWLAHDCIIFAADWVAAKTGHDPMADMRGKSFKQSLRQLQAEGGFKASADMRLGESVPPLYARVGDVVLVRSGSRQKATSGYSFGVCLGAHIASPGLRGLKFVPITLAEAAWHV